MVRLSLEHFDIFEKIISISEPISIAPESTKSIEFKLKANSDLSEKILVLEEINLYCGGVVFQIDRNRLPVESADRLPMTSWISQHKSLHIGPVEKSRTFAQRPGFIIGFENFSVFFRGTPISSLWTRIYGSNRAEGVPLKKLETLKTIKSCKILPPKPKAKLEFENPKVLHTGEILEIKLDFEIYDELENDAKITIQTNKESLIERSKAGF